MFTQHNKHVALQSILQAAFFLLKQNYLLHRIILILPICFTKIPFFHQSRKTFSLKDLLQLFVNNNLRVYVSTTDCQEKFGLMNTCTYLNRKIAFSNHQMYRFIHVGNKYYDFRL